jgi:hypothetical protein
VEKQSYSQNLWITLWKENYLRLFSTEKIEFLLIWLFFDQAYFLSNNQWLMYVDGGPQRQLKGIQEKPHAILESHN